VSAVVAHPLIVQLPKLAAPVGAAVRWAVLARLRSAWAAGRLDLVLPNGECVRLGGAGPADATARIHDDRVFLRLLLRGEMGGGEAFVAGEWSSDDLVATLRAFLRGTAALGAESPLTRFGQLPSLLRHRLADNSRDGSVRNVHAHYDLGNDFYRLFLDPETLAYSCALYDEPDDAPTEGPAVATALAAAQHAKLERLCELLELEESDHLLELGCGWGGLAIHAAANYGCRVTAITVSRAQHELATERVAAAGLASRVDVQLRDYRDLGRGLPAELDGAFDKLASVEMLEAVGYEHLAAFFATCARVLRPDGRMALQSITMPDARFDAYRQRVDWMQRYIFPGSCIPSLAVIRKFAGAAGLTVSSADDIGPSYVPTLAAWRARFLAELPAVRALGFDEPFVRTWLLYLAFSEAAFAERTLADHQLLLARP
jgi:cyclopropane-fatty-acyl-phospholipid synthase